jgi:hypothetical protein
MNHGPCPVCGSADHALCGVCDTAGLTSVDPVLAELTRLRAEVETLNQRLGACQGGYELAEQEVKQLRATIARLEADARRYRLIRDMAVDGTDVEWMTYYLVNGDRCPTKDELDAEFDRRYEAALSAPTGKGEA